MFLSRPLGAVRFNAMATAMNQLPSSEDLHGRISVLYSSDIESLDQFVAYTKKQWISIKDLQALPGSEQCSHIILVEVEGKNDLTDIRKTNETWMSYRVKEVAPMPRFEKAISALPVSLVIQNRAGLVAKERIDNGDILAIVSPFIRSSPKSNWAFDLCMDDSAYVFVWKQGNRTSASANAKVPVFKPPVGPEPTRRSGDLYHYSSLYDCAQRLNDKRHRFYALVTGILRPPSQGRASHSSWHAMYAIVDETCHMPSMKGTEEYEQWITRPEPQPIDYVLHIFEKGGKDAFPPIIVGDVIRVHGAVAELRPSCRKQIKTEIPQSNADFRTFSGSSVVIFRPNEPPISTGGGYSFTDEERRLAIKMLDFSKMYMQKEDKANKVLTLAELSGLAAEPETFVNLAGRLVLLKRFFENGKHFFLIYLEDGTFCNLPLEKLTSNVTNCVRPNQKTPSHFPVVKINVPVPKQTFDFSVGMYLTFQGILMKKSRQADYEYYSFDLRGVVQRLSSWSKLHTIISERIANSKGIVKEDSPTEGLSQIASLRCAPGPSCDNRTVQIARNGAFIPIGVTSKMNEDEIELDECGSESEEELSLRLSRINLSSLKRAYTFRHIESTGGKRLAKDSDLNGQRDSNHTTMAAGVHAYEEGRRDQMERNVSKVFFKSLVQELDLDNAYSIEDLKQGGRKSKIITIGLDERLGEMSVRDILSEWVFGICSSCCRAYPYNLFRTFTSDTCVRRDVIPSYPRSVLSRMVLNNFSDGSANAGEDEVQQSPRFTCRLYHCPQCNSGNVEFTECHLAPTFVTTLQLKDEHGQNLELYLGGPSAEYFFGVSVNAFLHKTTARERFMANLRKLAGQTVYVGVEVTVDNEGQQQLQIVGTKNEF